MSKNSDINTVTEEKENSLVEYEVPLTYDGERDAYPVLCSHNLKTYLLKPGEKVMIPKALADRFKEVKKAKVEAYEYSRKNSLDVSEAAFNRRYGLS